MIYKLNAIKYSGRIGHCSGHAFSSLSLQCINALLSQNIAVLVGFEFVSASLCCFDFDVFETYIAFGKLF